MGSIGGYNKDGSPLTGGSLIDSSIDFIFAWNDIGKACLSPNLFKALMDEMVAHALSAQVLENLTGTREGNLGCRAGGFLFNIEPAAVAAQLKGFIQRGKPMRAVCAVEPGADDRRRPLHCEDFLFRITPLLA